MDSGISHRTERNIVPWTTPRSFVNDPDPGGTQNWLHGGVADTHKGFIVAQA